MSGPLAAFPPGSGVASRREEVNKQTHLKRLNFYEMNTHNMLGLRENSAVNLLISTFTKLPNWIHYKSLQNQTLNQRSRDMKPRSEPLHLHFPLVFQTLTINPIHPTHASSQLPSSLIIGLNQCSQPSLFHSAIPGFSIEIKIR